MLLKALDSPAARENVDNIFADSEDGKKATIEFLELLVNAYPTDEQLCRAYGNELLRQNKITEAQATYDISVRISRKNSKASRIEDIPSPVFCDKCNASIWGVHYKCPDDNWNVDLCAACARNTDFVRMIRIPSNRFQLEDDE